MKQIFIIILSVVQFSLSAQEFIDVRLFSRNNLTEVWVSANAAPYYIISVSDGGFGDTLALLNPRQSVLNGTLNANGLSIKVNGIDHNGLNKIILLAKNDTSAFVIKGKGRERIYSGSLFLEKRGAYIYCINRVKLEDYVAGVVESEAGHVAQYEYFKAQAVLARSWVLRNMKKHAKEGYNVKDDVSSQAYYSKAYLQNSTMILKAVAATRDTVLFDEKKRIVIGAFHANSGGETVNSEDYWQQPVSYLKSTLDTFSLAGEKAYWQVKISKEKFIGYFAQKLNQNANDSAFRNAVLNINQVKRMPFFIYNGKQLKMRAVREKFGLRSTFFSVSNTEDQVVLNGKGFGHGIGLSQEGAMRMADLGYSYKEILAHYFKNTTFGVPKP